MTRMMIQHYNRVAILPEDHESKHKKQQLLDASVMFQRAMVIVER